MSLKDETPAQTLDTLGRVCPYPLLLTKKALEKLGNGQVLKVLCDATASAELSAARSVSQMSASAALTVVRSPDRDATGPGRPWALLAKERAFVPVN